jgi:RsiW-degrading membrane proteinase PrsW (M82 family)
VPAPVLRSAFPDTSVAILAAGAVHDSDDRVRVGRGYSPPVPPIDHWSRLRRALLVGFLVVVMSLCGLLLLAIFTSATGWIGFLIGICLAALPLPVVLGAFRWLDRYEPEPRGLLVFAFFWGATVAALVSAVLNTASALAIARTGGPAEGLVTTAVLVAPWVEEAAKGAAVLLVLLFRRQEFDGVVDGIVLGGLAGVGFAFTENILYFGRAFLAGGEELGVTGGIFAVGFTFVLRGVLSPFAHPLFTAMTGIGLGLAARGVSPATRWLAPVGGYLAAVVLHATWNWASLSGLSGFFTGYVVVMVPAFAATIAVATWSRRREGATLVRHLPAYVAAGWLAPEDVPMLASMPRRRQAVRWVQGRYGEAGGRALRRFQHSATELAFLRDRLDRGHDVPDFPRRERELLDEMSRSRSAAAGPRG